MALPRIEGRITVPTGGYVVTVKETYSASNSGNVAITLPAGDYYWSSTLGSNSALTTKIKNLLDTNATLVAARAANVPAAAVVYTVTLVATADSDSGGIQIGTSTFTNTNQIDFTWTSTAFRNLLGYAGNFSISGGTQGSDYAVQQMWLPNVGRAAPLAPDGDQGADETDMIVTMSPSGYSKALQYNVRYRDRLEFRFLKGSKVWTTYEITTNESLQTFYSKVIEAGGNPLRYYKDRSNSANFVTFRALWPSFADSVQAFNQGWHGSSALFNVGFDVVKMLP